MISFIIPTRNNLPYLGLAYKSIRKYYPSEEIIILDDNSTDGTKDFLWGLEGDGINYGDQNLQVYINEGRQVGHTVLYDKGVELATNDIFSIFHADMVCGPNYVENMVKWLKPSTVVAATRIEPPLHPAGKEKIVENFGIYDDEFKELEFSNFCSKLQESSECKNVTTKGIFAPWAMYKKDFLAIGGHDKLFAPFPYEDSDLFQRLILAGYDIIQSRDAFVYHFTCRGHRWTKEVQNDDLFYKFCCVKNANHFLRKWGSWIQNNENCYPIIKKKYDIGLVVKNCNRQLLYAIEPICNTVYADNFVKEYINQTQSGTPFDMSKRVKDISEQKTNDIIIQFDGNNLHTSNFEVLKLLPEIISESGEIGKMEYDIFQFDIKALTTYENKLVNINDPYYQNQLRPLSSNDPYCLDKLFDNYQEANRNK